MEQLLLPNITYNEVNTKILFESSQLPGSRKNYYIEKEYNPEECVSLYNTKDINISEYENSLYILDKNTYNMIKFYFGHNSLFDKNCKNDVYFSFYNIGSCLKEINSEKYITYSHFLKGFHLFESNKEIKKIELVSSGSYVFETKNNRYITEEVLKNFKRNIKRKDTIILTMTVFLYLMLNSEILGIKNDLSYDDNEKLTKEIKQRKKIGFFFNSYEIDFNIYSSLYSNYELDIIDTLVRPSHNNKFHKKTNEIHINKEIIEDLLSLYVILEKNAKLRKYYFKDFRYPIKNFFNKDKFFNDIIKKANLPYNDPLFNQIKEAFDFDNKEKNEHEYVTNSDVENIKVVQTNIINITEEVKKPNSHHSTPIDKKIADCVNKKHDLIYINNKDYIKEIKTILDKKFPWMDNLNDIIIKSLISCFTYNNHISIDPIIIEGNSGIGKSSYVSMLSDLLNLPYVKYSAGGKSEFLDFTGTSSNWGDSKPSLMLQMILNSNILNSFIFIDELDKSLSNHNGDLQSSLLDVTEKNEAKRYFDTFLSKNIDISHMNYIIAINDVSKVNRYLLDRCNLVKVGSPKEEHFDLIYDNLLDEYAKLHNVDIDEILKTNIPKHKIFNDFKMNYSLRKTKKNIYNYIEEYNYNKFFEIKKPKISLI